MTEPASMIVSVRALDGPLRTMPPGDWTVSFALHVALYIGPMPRDPVWEETREFEVNANDIEAVRISVPHYLAETWREQVDEALRDRDERVRAEAMAEVDKVLERIRKR